MFQSRATGGQRSHSNVGFEDFWRKYEKGAGKSTTIRFDVDRSGNITKISLHQCQPGDRYGPGCLTYQLEHRAKRAGDGNHRLVIVDMNNFSESAIDSFHQNAAETWTLKTFTKGNVGIAYGIKALALLLFSLSLNDGQCGGTSREERIEFLDLHIMNIVRLQKNYPDWFKTAMDECLNPNTEDHLGSMALRSIMSSLSVPGWSRLSDADYIRKLFWVMQRNRKHSKGRTFKFCDNLGGVTAFLIARYFGSGCMSVQESVTKVVTNLLTSIKKYLEISSRPVTPVASDEYFDWFFHYSGTTAWGSTKSFRAMQDEKENIAFIQAILECCLNQYSGGTEELIPHASQVYDLFIKPGSGAAGDKKLVVQDMVSFPDGSSFRPQLPLPSDFLSDGCTIARTLPTTYEVSGGGTQDFTAVGIPLPEIGTAVTFTVSAKGLVSGGTGGRGARTLVRLLKDVDFSRTAWKANASGGGITVSSRSGGGCGDGKSNPITAYGQPAPAPLSSGADGELYTVTVEAVSLQNYELKFRCPGWKNPMRMTYTNEGSQWVIRWLTSGRYSRVTYRLNRSKLTHLGLFFKGLVNIRFTESTRPIHTPKPSRAARKSSHVSGVSTSSPALASVPKERSLQDMIKDGLKSS